MLVGTRVQRGGEDEPFSAARFGQGTGVATAMAWCVRARADVGGYLQTALCLLMGLLRGASPDGRGCQRVPTAGTRLGAGLVRRALRGMARERRGCGGTCSVQVAPRLYSEVPGSRGTVAVVRGGGRGVEASGAAAWQAHCRDCGASTQAGVLDLGDDGAEGVHPRARGSSRSQRIWSRSLLSSSFDHLEAFLSLSHTFVRMALEVEGFQVALRNTVRALHVDVRVVWSSGECESSGSRRGCCKASRC